MLAVQSRQDVRHVGLPTTHPSRVIFGATKKVVCDEHLRGLSPMGFKEILSVAALNCFPAPAQLYQRDHSPDGCLPHLRWPLQDNEAVLLQAVQSLEIGSGRNKYPRFGFGHRNGRFAARKDIGMNAVPKELVEVAD